MLVDWRVSILFFPAQECVADLCLSLRLHCDSNGRDHCASVSVPGEGVDKPRGHRGKPSVNAGDFVREYQNI